MSRTRLVVRVVGVMIAGASAIGVQARATVEGSAVAAARVHSHPSQLPQGGRRIVGHYRVVAFYGAAGGASLGILGSKPPSRIAADINVAAKQWRGHRRTVQPAMELIATVAQGGPGPDGMYSKPIATADARRYLRVAQRQHMLLILDFQPGRADFLDQVKRFAPILRDPWVSVALDPEWKMHGKQVPGKVIGHTDAAAVIGVRDYLAGLVERRRLPDKLLVVHQFRPQMIRHRSRIGPSRGVEIVYHADGFGPPAEKLATWQRLAFPGRQFGTGFKLFTRQDKPMMTPRQVLALRPRVDLITYQ